MHGHPFIKINDSAGKDIGIASRGVPAPIHVQEMLTHPLPMQ